MNHWPDCGIGCFSLYIQCNPCTRVLVMNLRASSAKREPGVEYHDPISKSQFRNLEIAC